MRIAPILQSSAFIGVSFTLFVSCLTFQIYALLSYTKFTKNSIQHFLTANPSRHFSQ